MVQKSKGFKSGTRKKLKKKSRTLVTSFLKEFKIGERVVIVPIPSSTRGMPFPRFKGRSGTIVDKRGDSYILEVLEGKKKKQIISRPEHLKPLNA